MQKEIEKRKYNYITIAKGIGIFLVIWAHILNRGPVYNFIYAFHMPLFFFISGMLFKNDKYTKIKDLLKSRFKSLIIPYLIYSIITLLLWGMIENKIWSECIKCFWEIFLARNSSRTMPFNPPLWFIPCLFSIEIIYFFINKYIKKGMKAFLIFCLAISGFLLTRIEFPINGKDFIWSLNISFVALTFYWVGNALRKRFGLEQIENFINKNKIKNIIKVIIGIVFLSISTKYNRNISMGSDNLEMNCCF